jgi:nucleoside-diphosphate-sugar epimerase
VDDLVTMIEEIAGVKLERKYQLDAPRGVAGRNSDNTLIKQILNWEPSIPLRQGMEQTYRWIEAQYLDRKAGKPTPAGDRPMF